MVVLDTDVWSFLFKRDTRAERCYPLLTHNAADYAGVVGLTLIGESSEIC